MATSPPTPRHLHTHLLEVPSYPHPEAPLRPARVSPSVLNKTQACTVRTGCSPPPNPPIPMSELYCPRGWGWGGGVRISRGHEGEASCMGFVPFQGSRPWWRPISAVCQGRAQREHGHEQPWSRCSEPHPAGVGIRVGSSVRSGGQVSEPQAPRLDSRDWPQKSQRAGFGGLRLRAQSGPCCVRQRGRTHRLLCSPELPLHQPCPPGCLSNTQSPGPWALQQAGATL